MENEKVTPSDPKDSKQPEKNDPNYFVLEDGITPMESEDGQKISPESEQDDKSKK